MLRVTFCICLLCLAGPSFATPFIYIAEDGFHPNYTHKLYNYDSETSISTLRTSIPGPYRFFSMVYFPDEKVVLAVDPSANSKLYNLNINGGAATLIAETGLVDIDFLARNPVTNELYGLGVNSHNLYRINPWTGASSLVGNAGLASRSIAFAPNGDLYAFHGGFLYKIDTTNAHPTLIGGKAANLGEHDAKITPEGVMYFVSYNEIFNGGMYSVDLATGAYARVDKFPDPEKWLIARGLALLDNPPVPEPSTIATLAAASVILLQRRRRR